MTAVAEPPTEPIVEYTMPRPCRGQAVTWYAHGTANGPGETGFVMEIGKRNIVLHRASGVCMDGVRHIDDPKLKLSAEQRESGAWDFTDESKRLLASEGRLASLEGELTALRERIATMEALFNEPSKKVSTAKKDSTNA